MSESDIFLSESCGNSNPREFFLGAGEKRRIYTDKSLKCLKRVVSSNDAIFIELASGLYDCLKEAAKDQEFLFYSELKTQFQIKESQEIKLGCPLADLLFDPGVGLVKKTVLSDCKPEPQENVCCRILHYSVGLIRSVKLGLWNFPNELVSPLLVRVSADLHTVSLNDSSNTSCLGVYYFFPKIAEGHDHLSFDYDIQAKSSEPILGKLLEEKAYRSYLQFHPLDK